MFKRHLKPKIIKQGRYIRLLRQGGWEYIERANCTGIVIILAMTGDRKVVFVRQYRIPVDADVIEFPAGLINDDALRRRENAVTAARRELLEETGYLARRIFKVTEGPAGSGLSSDILTVVQAIGLKKVGKGGGDETENIVVCEVPLAKAEVWLKAEQRRGHLVDPKVYAGLYFLQKYNKTTLTRTKKRSARKAN
jgi:ADP-ribose pyrophosphatase